MAEHRLQPAGGEPVVVRVEWSGAPGRAREMTVHARGETLAGSASLDPGGTGRLDVGSRIIPFFWARAGDELELWLDGEVYRFSPGREEQPGKSGMQVLPPGGRITAPMPGLVLQVLVQPGQSVEAGEPLVLLESMKLQLAVPAPAPARVAEVLCQPGATVDLGEALVRLDPAE